MCTVEQDIIQRYRAIGMIECNYSVRSSHTTLSLRKVQRTFLLPMLSEAERNTFIRRILASLKSSVVDILYRPGISGEFLP